MAAYLLISKRDSMNLLLLGYLYFCVTISSTESSDLNTIFPEISEKYVVLDNCTQCDVKRDSSCVCFDYDDRCVVCCPNKIRNECCSCTDCTICWYEQRQLIMITQISISILFGFGIIGLIIVYCKICNKTRLHARQRARTRRTRRRCVLREELDPEIHCSTIDDLRDRPPSYNEVVRSASPVHTSSRNNAPPLYASPYNRTSMQEAPPSYPGTPKPQEKIQDSNKPPSSLPVIQHI